MNTLFINLAMLAVKNPLMVQAIFTDEKLCMRDNVISLFQWGPLGTNDSYADKKNLKNFTSKSSFLSFRSSNCARPYKVKLFKKSVFLQLNTYNLISNAELL